MTQVVSRSLANAVYLPKHDGNGDNRFAILVEGSEGDNDFEKSQFKAGIQEMGRLLTEHPRNIKPGPGYTGYYLQDQIFYVGIHDGIPEVERDVKVTSTNGKSDIESTIKEVARKCNSYDKIMFFYTAHGKYDWETGIANTFANRVYLFDANNVHTPYSVNDDISPSDLDGYLKTITCKDMIIILQPCYAGNWIDDDDTTKELLVDDGYEKNRVVFTSEVKAQDVAGKRGKVSIFDKCNYYIGDPNKRCVKLDSGEEDGEKFYSYPQSDYKYVASDNANNINDGVYEINRDNEEHDTTIDFYENQNDEGPEFVSGLTEAYYIDRDYYYYDGGLQHHQPNNYLDADDNDANNDPEITQGNQNKYISCEEAYYFMLNWHLGYRLGNGKIGAPDPGSTNTWYDNPQYEPTNLEEGNNYLF